MYFPPYKRRSYYIYGHIQKYDTYRTKLKDKKLIKRLDDFINESKKFEDNLTEFINEFYEDDIAGIADILYKTDLKDIYRELIKQQQYLDTLEKAINNHKQSIKDVKEFLKDNYSEKLI